ncbi:DUF4407 domain-containing protein [Undibacterium sp. CY18W]|uniref:DUF4407 domain-containing protein n=1 Tax=Undibacterium hunanense TaxID=2762292 RepID=A0ABR6ZXS8_9BURK|nr:DUF4407 domain-containing protein [Undibacterium hunanense]MBC3920589.1 DUF4407 domain-containing protein [Undibacterium hunanense]
MTMRFINGHACLQAGKSVLALSAAVSLKVLDQQDSNGNYLYARGRHKYFGIGALVIFFALFSGYGMAHMLASMVNVSSSGSIIAGCLWAMFQWCLERQMIMSIHSDSSWVSKTIGISWRSLLALLSAITMVYPFFVDSNRAEIDVKVGEMTRTRLIQNLQTAEAATGLPVLQKSSTDLDEKLRKAEDAILSDPPQLAEMRKQLHNCRDRAREEERKGMQQIASWQQALSGIASINPETALLQQKISATQNRIKAGKARCQQYEQEINNSLLAWKNEKLADKTLIATALKQTQSSISKAQERSNVLEQKQTAKIEAAAASGFAADFAATWQMLQDDQHRRLQFIWWLLWFLTIEMVAIIIKFSSHTDVDAKLNSDEELVKFDISQSTQMRRAELALRQLHHAMNIKGQQAALQADDGKSAAALATLQRLHELEKQAETGSGLSFESQQMLQQTISAMHDSFARLLLVK